MMYNAAANFPKALKPITLATMLACAAMNAQAGYDGVVIIGDSLSDGGYYSAIGAKGRALVGYGGALGLARKRSSGRVLRADNQLTIGAAVGEVI